MVKYVILDCAEIITDECELITVNNPVYYKYVNNLKINRDKQTFKSYKNTSNILVIENEDFEIFSLLDEMLYYKENNGYDLLLNNNKGLEKINYIKKSNSDKRNSCLLNYKERTICESTLFSSIIFKNCKNFKKITNVVDAALYFNYVNAGLRHCFIWNCPKFNFEFTQMSIYKKNQHDRLDDIWNEIKFYISDNFNIIFNFDNNIINNIIDKQKDDLRLKTNEIDTLKTELFETKYKLSEFENIIKKLSEKIENIESKISNNEKTYSFYT